MKETIKNIMALFNKKEKKMLLILFSMMIIAALFETIGIGLIVPLVGILTNSNIIQEQKNIIVYISIFKFPINFIVYNICCPFFTNYICTKESLSAFIQLCTNQSNFKSEGKIIP